MNFGIIDYSLFISAVILLILFDIISHKKTSVVSLKSALIFSCIYIASAMAFALYIMLYHGKESASLFLTGYTLEKILAFDNLFVFSMIFSYFKISDADQHKALHWGIAGAILFRLIFVAIGVSSLLLLGPVMELIFAALIIASIYFIIKAGDGDDIDYEKMACIKLARKIHPSITPLFVSIIAIEVSDILFSFDSVPAIIAVTKEPFLVYSSMIFAILGLRSLYFVISALSRFLVFMDEAIIIILGFISAKLILSATIGFHISPVNSLGIIISILASGILLSLIKLKRKNRGDLNVIYYRFACWICHRCEEKRNSGIYH